jgi:hypothetical protein
MSGVPALRTSSIQSVLTYSKLAKNVGFKCYSGRKHKNGVEVEFNVGRTGECDGCYQKIVTTATRTSSMPLRVPLSKGR